MYIFAVVDKIWTNDKTFLAKIIESHFPLQIVLEQINVIQMFADDISVILCWEESI